MAIGKLVGTLGIGLVAGFVGTAAITASQMVEMRIRGRKPSDAPAKAAEKVLHLSPEDEAAEAQLNTLAHWGYGTMWGLFRPALAAFGVRGWPATALHFAAIQGTAVVMLPALKIAPPAKEWGATEITVEMVHHAIYAVVAGLTYEMMTQWLLRDELPVETAREPEGRLPVGAIAAGLVTAALRRWPPQPVKEAVPKLRVAFWQAIPDAVRDRVGDWERKLEGV